MLALVCLTPPFEAADFISGISLRKAETIQQDINCLSYQLRGWARRIYLYCKRLA